MKTKSNTQIELRRSALIHLSVEARTLREQRIKEASTERDLLYWSSIRINDIIADRYRKESGANVFKSFQQWQREGFRVRKGEKAYVLWSKKRNVTKSAGENEEPNEISYKFFPIAYLFSDLQVEPQKEFSDAN